MQASQATWDFPHSQDSSLPGGEDRQQRWRYGNHWLLAPGHEIRLDLTQVDQPYLRPNNLPSSIVFGSPTLVLPTREPRTRRSPARREHEVVRLDKACFRRDIWG